MADSKELKDADFTEYEVVGVMPLLPCVIACRTSEQETLTGIAGFYDPSTRRFIRLDGKLVSEDMMGKVSAFIDKKFPDKKDM